MLNRRKFLVSSCLCCSATALGVVPSRSDTTPKNFTCGTVDTVLPGELDVQLLNGTNDELKMAKDNLNSLQITPYGTAFLKDRWPLPPGASKITLKVYFYNGSASDQEAVRSAASQWINGPLGSRLALDFNVASPTDANIRVNFGSSEGNWSYVGRQNAAVRHPAHTMNIAEVVDYVIMHEFGHAWGLQHEHQFPGGIKWNAPQVIKDMNSIYGWSAEMTQQQMLNQLSKSAVCIGDPKFNKELIMLYPIQADWTLPDASGNRFSSNWNTRISDGDIRCVAGLYSIHI